jgi:hypothetical protein
MALDDILRNGVSLANTLTNSLQTTVSYEAYSSQDSFGDITYAAAVNVKAVVERKSAQRHTSSGQIIATKARITFLTPQTIDIRDKITLSDGTTGPIVDIVGVEDSNTTKPYATEVWLGEGDRIT